LKGTERVSPSSSGGGLLGGSLLHASLAAYYEIFRLGGQRPPLLEIAGEFGAASRFLGADEHTENVVWAMLERWVEWEQEVYDYWRPLAIEVPLEARYGDATLTAKMDVYVEDTRNGQRFSVDHKLASAERGQLGSAYLLSPAVVTTMLTARDGTVVSGEGWPWMSSESSLAPDGSDGVKPGQKISVGYVFVSQVFTRKSPPPGRGASVLPRREVLDAYRERVRDLAPQLAAAPPSAVAWPQIGLVTDACRHFERPCDFTDLCTSGGRARGLYETDGGK